MRYLSEGYSKLTSWDSYARNPACADLTSLSWSSVLFFRMKSQHDMQEIEATTASLSIQQRRNKCLQKQLSSLPVNLALQGEMSASDLPLQWQWWAGLLTLAGWYPWAGIPHLSAKQSCHSWLSLPGCLVLLLALMDSESFHQPAMQRLSKPSRINS